MNFNHFVLYYFHIQQLLCVLPITLSFHTFKLKHRNFSIFYSASFATSLVLIDLFIQDFFNSRTDNVVLNISFQSFSNVEAYTVVVVCIFCSTYERDNTILMFRKLRIIFDKLKILKIQTKFSKLFETLIIYSVITELILLNIQFIFYFVQNEINWIAFFFVTTISTVKYIIGSAFLIQMNVIFLMIRSISTMFNKILKNKIAEMSKLKKTNKWIKIKFDCEMSDFVDELIEIYRALGVVTRLASKTFGFTVLAIGSYVLKIVVTQFFQSYLFLIRYLKTGRNMDLVSIIIMLAWPFVRLLIFSRTLCYGEKALEKVKFLNDLSFNFVFSVNSQAKRTGQILHKINKDQMDIRLKRSVCCLTSRI